MGVVAAAAAVAGVVAWTGPGQAADGAGPSTPVAVDATDERTADGRAADTARPPALPASAAAGALVVPPTPSTGGSWTPPPDLVQAAIGPRLQRFTAASAHQGAAHAADAFLRRAVAMTREEREAWLMVFAAPAGRAQTADFLDVWLRQLGQAGGTADEGGTTVRLRTLGYEVEEPVAGGELVPVVLWQVVTVEPRSPGERSGTTAGTSASTPVLVSVTMTTRGGDWVVQSLDGVDDGPLPGGEAGRRFTEVSP